ncbi:restriction endonuclease subunit S, partial [Oscillibacter ruminantium]
PSGIINQALLKLTAKPGISNKYLKYYFENSITTQMNSNAQGGAIKNVASVSVLKDIAINVPPLKQQEHIVAILDRFDTLCNGISTGLPAEIAVRQKQYEYYRDKLLTFKEAE